MPDKTVKPKEIYRKTTGKKYNLQKSTGKLIPLQHHSFQTECRLLLWQTAT